MQLQMRMCDACGINPAMGRARKCEGCSIALRKANAALAVYRHRVRAANGKARHNQTYKGKPTRWVIERAIEVLAKSGVIKIPR